jgi:hypothetical protein
MKTAHDFLSARNGRASPWDARRKGLMAMLVAPPPLSLLDAPCVLDAQMCGAPRAPCVGAVARPALLAVAPCAASRTPRTPAGTCQATAPSKFTRAGEGRCGSGNASNRFRPFSDQSFCARPSFGCLRKVPRAAPAPKIATVFFAKSPAPLHEGGRLRQSMPETIPSMRVSRRCGMVPDVL